MSATQHCTPISYFWHRASIPSGIIIVMLKSSITRKNKEKNVRQSTEKLEGCKPISPLSKSRSQQFSLGREAARLALSQLSNQMHDAPLHKQLSKAPLWPNGVVGSISHTADLALAAVAWQHQSMGIGIDLETIRSPSKKLLKRILTPTEQSWWKSRILTAQDHFFTTIFSAKESLFKLIHPLTNQYLGFQQAEIELLDENSNPLHTGSHPQPAFHMQEGSLTWRIVDAHYMPPQAKLSSGQGWWQSSAEYTSTLLWKLHSA